MNQIETATSDSKMDCQIFGTKARAYKEKQTIFYATLAKFVMQFIIGTTLLD